MSTPTPPEALRRIEKCRKTKATKLDLSKCELTEIPTELADLVWLERLDFYENQISEIKNLDALSSLTQLDLSENQISEIKNLDTLSSLTELYLSSNQINSLSGLPIDRLEKLEKIDLSDNPIEGTTITDWQNPKAISGYLQSQEGDLVPNYHLKVNIIGEGRIGKTQLFKYWSKKRYKANEDATHGTLTSTLSIPQSQYKATIWDFGGQAYHHSFHHVFLRPNDFYLVLWRNNPERNPDYGYWLGTARNFSRPSKKEYISPVVLVQNVWNETDVSDQKATHQPDPSIFPDSQKMQKYGVKLDDVFVIDIRNLHEKNPLWKARHDYFEVSLYQKMIAHAQNLLPKVSEKWLKAKERLDENPIKEINLTKETFHQQHAPDFDETALAGLLDYLEFAGNIIKFPEPSSLSNYVFPDPPKLSAWIYGTVLNKKMLEKNNGIIKYSSIQEKVGEDEAKIFLGIMKEFNLLFSEKGNENNLVIPQFLPENNNSFKRLLLELIPYSFCLRFADFFHESRIFQFISEYGMYADDKTSYTNSDLK